MPTVETTDAGMMLQRGRHFHFTRGDKWFTTVADGETVEGIVPDPDYKEPKVKLDGRAAPEGVKRALFQFKVMYCGWECDEDGWVVEMDDGSRKLVLMSHMALYVADPAELTEKLAEYDRVAADTRRALEMLGSDSGSDRNGENTEGG